jgi:hypothetical protein
MTVKPERLVHFKPETYIPSYRFIRFFLGHFSLFFGIFFWSCYHFFTFHHVPQGFMVFMYQQPDTSITSGGYKFVLFREKTRNGIIHCFRNVQ